MSERVRIERRDGIADVRMVRADKMNAVDADMFLALIAAGDELMSDRSVRAVVLSGEGRAFCSGLDIPSLMAGGGDRKGPRLSDRMGDSPANIAQRCSWVWQEVPMPVIAAVHGVAYGAGFQIAMGADIRFVAPDARLSLREAHWGLIPDVSVTQTLRHVIRHDVAKELTFTGKVVSGVEANEMGLVTHLSDDPHADAWKLAEEIAGRSPSAVRAGKQLWNQALDGSIEEGLALEAKLQGTVMGKPNQIEAVKANMEKRTPNFSDPE
ncbi:MAG: crotonase/enoyl-CoA hydratase family protein [Myxococcota bacterium]